MGEAVGIMGGTFDPIHFGHLVAAEEARARFGLSRVIFVPSSRPPHKAGYRPAAAERRYDMVVLATASNPGFEVSRAELERPGPSYSVDTVEELQGQLGAEARWFFIVGADEALGLPGWREPERLLGRCEFIAVTRPGYDLEGLRKALGPELAARVHLLEIPGVDISSTELRRRAAAGEPLRYLTPEAVVGYIGMHGLYSEGGAAGANVGV